MCVNAVRFTQMLTASKSELPDYIEWLGEWADSPEVKARCKAALNSASTVWSQYAEFARSTTELEPHGLEDWHIKLIVEECMRHYPEVRHIWLARKTLSADMGTPVFHVMIETSKVQEEFMENFTKGMLLPGYVVETVGYGMNIGNEACDRHLRNYRPALIYKREIETATRRAA